ncbi:hypothetical protein [Halapricum desulfuricans]|nr:hypothetical protein [Halapricum desulfuricans]
MVLYLGLETLLSSLGVAAVLEPVSNWLLRAVFVVVLIASITS